MTERGQITYTERAFEQDADLAMSSDVMRALVELVTNADDAFGANPGDVLVEIVRDKDEPTRLIVRDTARGLTPDQLKSCFSVL
jgi:C4-dicarboxylate-specific signal transduction histidine kinase